MCSFLYENHRGRPTSTLLNVLGVLNVLNVIIMPIDCWPAGPYLVYFWLSHQFSAQTTGGGGGRSSIYDACTQKRAQMHTRVHALAHTHILARTYAGMQARLHAHT